MKIRLWFGLMILLGLTASAGVEATAQVTGSGTVGKVPKWTGTSALGDSVITESTGNVGIGITNPASNFHVSSSTSNNVGFYFDAYPGGGSQMRFRWANGNPSAPTAVASGDRLGSIAFTGYTGGSGFGSSWPSAGIYV